MDERTRTFIEEIASKVDFEALFAALPEDEFSTMIDERLGKIEEEERAIEAAQKRIVALQREAEAFRGALKVKREMQEMHDRKTAEISLPVDVVPPPRELMLRKRSAVLRLLRADSDGVLAPEWVESAIRQRGILNDAELRAGTPIRIVMAKLAAEHVIDRVSPGRYRLAAQAALENGESPRVQSESSPTLPSNGNSSSLIQTVVKNWSDDRTGQPPG